MASPIPWYQFKCHCLHVRVAALIRITCMAPQQCMLLVQPQEAIQSMATSNKQYQAEIANLDQVHVVLSLAMSFCSHSDLFRALQCVSGECRTYRGSPHGICEIVHMGDGSMKVFVMMPIGHDDGQHGLSIACMTRRSRECCKRLQVTAVWQRRDCRTSSCHNHNAKGQ